MSSPHTTARFRIVLVSYSGQLWFAPAAAHALRFYITPHCPQCLAVTALKLHLCQSPLRALAGEGNRRYAKWPSLGGGRPVVGAPCSLRALRAVVRSPLWSACTVALVSCSASIPVSGLRPVITSLPLPTHRGPRRCAALALRAGCPSAPRGGSLSPRALVVYPRCSVAFGLRAIRPLNWVVPTAYSSEWVFRSIVTGHSGLS